MAETSDIPTGAVPIHGGGLTLGKNVRQILPFCPIISIHVMK